MQKEIGIKTPVAFIIFNRPGETARVFERIRAAQPEKLFIIADGPRVGRGKKEDGKEKRLCGTVRKIIERVDWPCEVKKEFSEENLGCKKRISSGLDWVFREVDRAVILEDDCLPEPSFFHFCEELLGKFELNECITHISGNFFQEKNKRFLRELEKEVVRKNGRPSYYFSIIPHIWGWATWRRAWQYYDVDIRDWPVIKAEGRLEHFFKNHGAYEYWSGVWDKYFEGKIDSWDGQWFLASASRGGICVNPTVNLVSNIGFSQNATHTKSLSDMAERKTQEMDLPIIHPEEILRDPSGFKPEPERKADAFTFRQNFGIDKKMTYRALRPVKKHFPRLYRGAKKLFGSK